MARVLVLRTGEAVNRVQQHLGAGADSFTVLFARALGDVGNGAGVMVRDVDITTRAEHDPLTSLDDVDGVIMTGSPAYVGDDAPWMRWGQRMLLRAIEEDVPLLGVCFGHQMLGRALGCDVGPNPRGREMGTVEVTLHEHEVGDDPLFAHLPREFAAQVTHRDVIRAPSSRVRVLAPAPHDGCHAVRVGKRAWGLQFHPEFDDVVMRLYLDERRDAINEAHGPSAYDTRLAALRATPHASSLLTRFAALCEERARGA
jgi:GMP synthase (glutamine-hydrolysing)